MLKICIWSSNQQQMLEQNEENIEIECVLLPTLNKIQSSALQGLWNHNLQNK